MKAIRLLGLGIGISAILLSSNMPAADELVSKVILVNHCLESNGVKNEKQKCFHVVDREPWDKADCNASGKNCKVKLTKTADTPTENPDGATIVVDAVQAGSEKVTVAVGNEAERCPTWIFSGGRWVKVC